MHVPKALLRHPTAAIAVCVLALAAAAVAVSSSSRPVHWNSPGAVGTAPVITIAWRAVGPDVDPWSGLGFGEQVRHALRELGAVVAHDTGLSHPLTTGGAGELATHGRQLHSSYVLGGTVGRKDGRSEIGMQLVRVEDSAIVWTSTFWRDATDLESLPSDLALTVSQVLETEASD